jgi:hypothetical protein
VEHQKREPSGIKTHEEIMELFKELKSIEEKIKNPEILGEEGVEQETIFREVEKIKQIPSETISEQQVIQPSGEIPLKKKEKRKRLLSLTSTSERKELQEERKKNRLPFWRKVKIRKLYPETTIDHQQQLEDIAPRQSTFTLQLDADGNLIGFPLKKQIPVKEKKQRFFFRRKGGPEQPEGEPVKGMKGKLLRMVTRRTPKKSSEGESRGGIGSAIKGIFKRKSKE